LLIFAVNAVDPKFTRSNPVLSNTLNTTQFCFDKCPEPLIAAFYAIKTIDYNSELIRIGPLYYFSILKRHAFAVDHKLLTVIVLPPKMKLFLLIFALQIMAAIAKSANHGRKEKIAVESQRQLAASATPGKLNFSLPRCTSNLVNHCMSPDLAGPYCQSLVANIAGTFKAKDDKTSSFPAQFRLRLNADQETKRITVDADQWNEQFSNSSDFYLDFYYATSQEW
jgi:hypothetical protein